MTNFKHVDENRPIKGTRLPRDLTIHEMYTMVDSELIFFVATREIEGLPEEKGIDCIIGEANSAAAVHCSVIDDVCYAYSVCHGR